MMEGPPNLESEHELKSLVGKESQEKLLDFSGFYLVKPRPHMHLTN